MEKVGWREWVDRGEVDVWEWVRRKVWFRRKWVLCNERVWRDRRRVDVMVKDMR